MGTSDRGLLPVGVPANALLPEGEGVDEGICVTVCGFGDLPSPRRSLPGPVLVVGPARLEDPGGDVGAVLETSLRLAAGRLLTSESVAETGTRVLEVGI